MGFDLKSYLLGKQDKPFIVAYDLPSWLMGKAQSGDTKTLTGTLPLYVRSRASQILQNYIIYGTASGVGERTGNLFDVLGTFGKYNPNTTISVIDAKTISITGIYFVYQIYQVKPNTDYYLYTIPYSDDSQPGRMIVGVDNAGTAPNTSDVVIRYSPTVFSFSFNTGERDHIALLLYSSSTNVPGTVTYSNTMLTEGSTPPESYIPHGYKLPITVTSNGTTTDYPVYIGDSQLGEEEYVDYEEQKIYKLVDGTLTPTDPPVPLPDITLPQGEVMIDIEGDLKPQATVKGKIEQIT